jgi:hypothetical protein
MSNPKTQSFFRVQKNAPDALIARSVSSKTSLIDGPSFKTLVYGNVYKRQVVQPQRPLGTWSLELDNYYRSARHSRDSTRKPLFHHCALQLLRPVPGVPGLSPVHGSMFKSSRSLYRRPFRMFKSFNRYARLKSFAPGGRVQKSKRSKLSSRMKRLVRLTLASRHCL